ncbi:MAG: SMP-30/gluconolactonase/LRE family protein [Acidobacteriia bacterium]|nr:SMP-30/gluconolactonase/LRE family protein [Terriglobia bacterium]
MTRLRIVNLLLGLMLVGALAQRPPAAFGQQLEAASPAFWKLIDKDARLEKVADGFQFTEGPVWNPAGFLLFSDIPANQIVKFVPGAAPTAFRTPSGNSNGLTYDRAGRLLACEHSNRRVTRQEADGSLTVLASSYDGKKLNSPNDIVVRSDGTIYFTDPPYGIREEQKELPFQGVYKISPEGKLTLLAQDFDRPNGIALSPDEKTLYVEDSARLHVRAFAVAPDGSISHGRILAELKSARQGVPDGMKVDRKRNLYVTGPGGVWVFDKRGKHLGTILMAELPANCGWGDADYRTLYLTARTGLYRIRLKIPGFITYPTTMGR